MDGVLRGQMAAGNGSSYVGDDGVVRPVTGGMPIRLDGNVTLCARATNKTDRYLEGQLAYLGAAPVAFAERLQEIHWAWNMHFYLWLALGRGHW